MVVVGDGDGGCDWSGNDGGCGGGGGVYDCDRSKGIEKEHYSKRGNIVI